MAAKIEETERGVERLIFFTDAVAAIAITLLILPLVDSVTSSVKPHPNLTVSKFIQDNLSQMFAFGLSFLIIARLWLANHRVLADTIKTTPVLMWLDIAWAFTIVILPLPTEITAVFHQSFETVMTYILSAFASTLCLGAISVYLYFNPRLQRSGKDVALEDLYGIVATVAAFLLAVLLELIFPALNYFALLALLVNIPLDYLVKPHLRNRASRAAAKSSASSSSGR